MNNEEMAKMSEPTDEVAIVVADIVMAVAGAKLFRAMILLPWISTRWCDIIEVRPQCRLLATFMTVGRSTRGYVSGTPRRRANQASFPGLISKAASKHSLP